MSDEPTEAEKACGCVVVMIGTAVAVAFGLAVLRMAGLVVIDFEQWLRRWN